MKIFPVFCCFVLALLVPMPAGAARPPVLAQAPPAPTQAESARHEPPAQQTPTPSGNLPARHLTGELLYRIVAAELAAHERQFDRASNWFLSLARETMDPRLAQKAFQTAVLAGNMDRAQRSIRVWLQLAPNDTDAMTNAVTLAASQGKTQGMARTLRTLIESAEQEPQQSSAPDPGTPPPDTHSDRDRAMRRAAAIVNRLDDKPAALKVLQDTLAPWQPASAIANLMLADAAWRAEQPHAALQAARQAQRLDATSEEIAQRMLAYGVQVNARDALARARAFLRQHPRADRLGVQLAAELVQQNRGTEALQTLARLQQQLPDNLNLLRAEADLSLQLNDLARAVAALETVNRRQPDDADLQYELGMLYERQGRPDDFERMMQAIIEEEPEHANALNALGYTWVDQNVRLDEARVLIERALQRSPDSPHILDSMGWYHYRAGNLALARSYLERAFAQLSAADVAAHLGEVLWHLDERDNARTLWREARENDANNEVLRDTMQRYGVLP